MNLCQACSKSRCTADIRLSLASGKLLVEKKPSAASGAAAQLRKDGTQMAKLLGPDFISLQVRNLSASRAFYTEMLGLTIDERFTAPDFVLFDTNTIPFALSQARVNLDEAPQPGWGVTLWLDCDSVNELHAKMATAGATIITQ